MYQDPLLLHDNISYPVGHPGNILNIKVLDIFVSLRAVMVSVILVNSRIEALTVADYCGINDERSTCLSPPSSSTGQTSHP
jgi:hypothetical protein